MVHKKKTKKKAPKKSPKTVLYVSALANQSNRIVQITAVEGRLYSLDERGRVFAYVDLADAADMDTEPGWYQIQNDSQRFVLVKESLPPPQVGPTGNGSNIARLAGDTLDLKPALSV